MFACLAKEIRDRISQATVGFCHVLWPSVTCIHGFYVLAISHKSNIDKINGENSNYLTYIINIFGAISQYFREF